MLAQKSPVSHEFIYMVHFSNFGHWSYEVFERLLFIAFLDKKNTTLDNS